MTDIVLLVIILGIFVGFLVQSFTGFAAGAIALPILVLVMPMRDAVVVISVFLFLSSLYLTIRNWRFVDKSALQKLGWIAVVGIAAGVATLKFGSPDVLVRLLGLFLASYAIYQFVKPGQVKILSNRHLSCGFIGGYFAGLFSVGGPFFACYLFNMLDDAQVLRATMLGILLVLATVRLVLLVLGGLVTIDLIRTTTIALPGFIVAIVLGQFLLDRVSGAIFKKISLFFLLVSGIALLLK